MVRSRASRMYGDGLLYFVIIRLVLIIENMYLGYSNNISNFILQGHSSFVTHLDWSQDSQHLRSNSGDYELLYCKLASVFFTFSPVRDFFYRIFFIYQGTPVSADKYRKVHSCAMQPGPATLAPLVSQLWVYGPKEPMVLMSTLAKYRTTEKYSHLEMILVK